MSFLWGLNQHNSWAVRRCHLFLQRKQGKNWLQKLSEDTPDTSPPPPCCSAALQMGLTLWLIKDLPGESAVMSLTFKRARSGSDCTKMVSALRTRGGRKLTNDFSGFARWQLWQAVNRENAISFVVNYQPTQSDTRQRKSSCSDSSFSCHAAHTSAKTTAPHTQTRSTLLPTCTHTNIEKQES